MAAKPNSKKLKSKSRTWRRKNPAYGVTEEGRRVATLGYR